MKAKKIIFIIIVFLLGLGYGGFILMKNTISENIKSDESEVKNSWVELKNNIITKNNKLIDSYSSDKLLVNIVSLALQSNKEIKKSEFCNLDIVEKEFYLNQELLSFKLSNSKLNVSLNTLVEKYNQEVLLFNRKYRSYPNRFFFKRFGYKEKEFFYLKYGEENKNPKKKKEDILNSFGI